MATQNLDREDHWRRFIVYSITKPCCKVVSSLKVAKWNNEEEAVL